MTSETTPSYRITLPKAIVKALLAFTTKDLSRMNLRQWRITPVGDAPNWVEIAATDGHALVQMRLVLDAAGDHAPSAPVIVRLYDKFRATAVVLDHNGWHVDDATTPHLEPTVFPPLEQVIPPHVPLAERKHATCYVRTDLLARLDVVGAAFGSKNRPVDLQLGAPLDPIRCEIESPDVGTAIVILMPLRR